MKEEFLYHLWKFQKFNSEGLKTADGESLVILHPGIQNDLSGPDFFNSRIKIGDQLWAGNVEMHLKSSDWYAHTHEIDPAYDNVILHVVWEHDVEIFRNDNSTIPTLVLKERIEDEIILIYQDLLEKNHLELNCEKNFAEFSDFQIQHWLERLFFERLQKKSELIHDLLNKTKNNWDAVLFIMLARSFGSKVNAEAFMMMAFDLDFKIIQKLSGNQSGLEALFLGQAGLIKERDQYGLNLLRQYDFLKHKFALDEPCELPPQFFRLRPDNFPTIRLAQLAALYSERKGIFQQLMQAPDLPSIKAIFDLNISSYWRSHYNFGKAHPERRKKLSSAFLNLIIINCLIPLKHSYFQFIGEKEEQSLQDLIMKMKAEKNAVVDLFNELRPGTAKSAMESQGLLQLKTNYCNLNKCLQCELGASLLRKSPKYN